MRISDCSSTCALPICAVPTTQHEKWRHRQHHRGGSGETDQQRLLDKHFLIVEHGLGIALVVKLLQARALVMTDVSKKGTVAVFRRILVQDRKSTRMNYHH